MLEVEEARIDTTRGRGGEMGLVVQGGVQAQGLVRCGTRVLSHDHLLRTEGSADLLLQIANEVGAGILPEAWRQWTTRGAAAGRPPGMQFKVR